MKKSLIALAMMAAVGAASAQSSVTLFGIVDVAVTRGQGSVADRTQLTSSGYNVSRIGFRGTEDLGGGLSASFWLEAGIEADNGQGTATNTNNQLSGVGPGRQGLTFNRRSTVSLAGSWGELRAGRDIVPSSLTVVNFDPFNNLGVGASLVAINSAVGGFTSDPAGARASNSIGYLLPARIGGFYGQAMYYMGENLEGPTEDDGTGFSARLGFASGPFNVSGAYGKNNFAIGDFETWNLGAQWDFGVVRMMGMYAHHAGSAAGATGSFDGDGWLLGGMIPVGAGEIKLAYSTYKVDLAASSRQAKKLAIGYVHNLSKRTAVYATYAHLNNAGQAAVSLGGSVTAPGTSSSGVDFGLRHSF